MNEDILAALVRGWLRDLLRKQRRELNAFLDELEAMIYPDAPFQVLGIPKTADYETAYRAYIERAKNLHPDHGGKLDEMMKLNRAWEEVKRAKGWS